MFSVIGFDKNGKECDHENFLSLAKKSIDTDLKSEKFWVKICTNGIDSGKLFDPSSSLLEDLKRFDNHTDKYRYSYKSVNKECFNFYISYLSSNNSSFLKNAERNIS